MDLQLRRYRIKKGKLDQFAEEWRIGVVPLREEFGFTVLGAWSLPEASEFVWVVGHEDFEEADRSYYESDARQQLEPNPAVHVEEVSHSYARQII